MTLISSAIGRVETTRLVDVAAAPCLAAASVSGLPAAAPAISMPQFTRRHRFPTAGAGRYGVTEQPSGWQTEGGRLTGGVETGRIAFDHVDSFVNHNSMKFSSRLGRSCSPPV